MSNVWILLGTIHYRYTSPSAGLHFFFQLDGANIGPQFSIAGQDVLVSQTSEAQQFTIAFYQAISAGSHTLTLIVSEALAVGTATIYWSQLAMKA